MERNAILLAGQRIFRLDLVRLGRHANNAHMRPRVKDRLYFVYNPHESGNGEGQIKACVERHSSVLPDVGMISVRVAPLR